MEFPAEQRWRRRASNSWRASESWPSLDRWRVPTLGGWRVGYRWPRLTLRNSYDLVLLLVLAITLPFLPGLPVSSGIAAIARVIVGVSAALSAPGFALTAVLFPRREDLDGLSRAALSIGLSVASIALLAVLLGQGPWGIRPTPIAVALALWIGLLSGAAIWRRLRLTSLELDRHPWAPDEANHTGDPRGLLASPQARAVLLALLATAMFAGVAVLSIDRTARTTEFYMLGERGQAEYYPRMAGPDQPLYVTIGIANRERISHIYQIQVWEIDAWDAGRQSLLAQADPVLLGAGERYEQQISWRMPGRTPPSAGTRRIEFRLFVDGRGAEPGGQAEAYRRLDLWIDVMEQP